jgi:hypothetical protein
MAYKMNHETKFCGPTLKALAILGKLTLKDLNIINMDKKNMHNFTRNRRLFQRYLQVQEHTQTYMDMIQYSVSYTMKK